MRVGGVVHDSYFTILDHRNYTLRTVVSMIYDFTRFSLYTIALRGCMSTNLR